MITKLPKYTNPNIAQKFCPMCDRSGVELRQESHVMPRFLMVQTKIEGKNVLISSENVHEKNQSDIKTVMICDDCEAQFKKDDDFAKDFFDNQKYIANQGIFYGHPCVKYKDSSFEPLRKFIFSIIIRYHLFLKATQNSNFLGPYFDKLKKKYKANDFQEDEFPSYFLQYDKYSFMTPPAHERYSGNNHIFFLLKDFRIWTYLDKRGTPEESFEVFQIKSNSVQAFTIPFDDSKLGKDLFKIAEKNAAMKKAKKS